MSKDFPDASDLVRNLQSENKRLLAREKELEETIKILGKMGMKQFEELEKLRKRYGPDLPPGAYLQALTKGTDNE